MSPEVIAAVVIAVGVNVRAVAVPEVSFGSVSLPVAEGANTLSPCDPATELLLERGYQAHFPRAALSYPDYLDWKKLNSVFVSLDVYNQRGFVVSTPAGMQRADGARVSDGFFRTLGVG